MRVCRRAIVMPLVLAGVCLAGVFRGSPARAQTPAPPAPAVPIVQFDDAIARALQQNPTVAEAATAIGRADALLQQARSATTLAVNASLSNVTLDHARGFQGYVTQPQDQATLGANASYPFLAFAKWAAVTQAKDQVEVAQFSTADVRRAIAVSTAQAYLAVITAHREVDVDQRALANAQAHLDYAQKLLDAGAGSRVNQLRAAGEVSSDQARLETTRLAVRTAQEALGVLLVFGGPVDVGAEPVFDVPVSADQDQDTSARTDVKLQTANQHAAERVLTDSRKDWFPSGNVSFVPQIVEPAGLFQPSKTWQLLVSVSQPVFDGGLRRAMMRQRQVAVDAAKLSLASVENQAKSEIRAARDSMQSFERSSSSARLAAQQANEVLQITTTAFELGATTNIEVIDAQRSARDAETVATLADDSARRARLDLLVALGRFPK